MMVNLKGITWDHPRGYDPLLATTETFSTLYPDISISWRKRTLKEFGDYPVEILVQQYDIILIDHPFMGEAYEKNLLLPLDEYLDPDFLALQRRESVGRSFDSYTYNGKQLALPIDSAALVSAARTEDVNKLGLSIPKSIDELFAFARQLPDRRLMAIPLCSTDIWCLFLTLCAQIAGPQFLDNCSGVPEKVALEAIALIEELKDNSHPESLQMNPITVLEMMLEPDSVIYCPFLFGYSNYSRPSSRGKTIHFFDAPLIDGAAVSTILGGVGIAISANTSYRREAIDYARYVTSPEIQAGIYFESGGQPGQLSAWLSEINNAKAGNFFKNTLWTLQNSYMRPRMPGWNKFQEGGSILLHEGIAKRSEPKNIYELINSLYRKTCVGSVKG